MMDFGSNSLWGSFSSVAATPVVEELAPSVVKETPPEPVVPSPSITLTPVSRTAPAVPDAVPAAETAVQEAGDKWDINEYLGARGDSCSSGHGVQCPECSMTFAFPGVLQVHRSKMHGVTPYPSCKSCNMVFRRIMGLINHWRTGVPHVKDRDGLKLLGCDICDSFNIINGFKDKEEIAEHTRAVHGQNVLIDSTNFDKPLCPLCQRGFTYRKGVIEHIQILHGEHLVVDLIGAQDPALQKRLIDELQYRCHYCVKTFRVKKSLLQHLEKFHNDTTGFTQPRPGSPMTTFKEHSVKDSPNASSNQAAPATPHAVASPALLLPQHPAFPAPSSAPTPPSKKSLSNRSKPLTSAISCPDCGKPFSRHSIMKIHRQMVHSNHKVSNGFSHSGSSAEEEEELDGNVESMDDDEYQ